MALAQPRSWGSQDPITSRYWGAEGAVQQAGQDPGAMDCLEETKTMEETQPMLNTMKEKWEEIHFSLLPTIHFLTTASCWPNVNGNVLAREPG